MLYEYTCKLSMHFISIVWVIIFMLSRQYYNSLIWIIKMFCFALLYLTCWYLPLSSASSWPTHKIFFVRIVATTFLLDPVRHTTQVMVLANSTVSFGLIFLVPSLGGIFLMWFATIQPAFPRKVGGANGSDQLVYYWASKKLFISHCDEVHNIYQQRSSAASNKRVSLWSGSTWGAALSLL